MAIHEVVEMAIDHDSQGTPPEPHENPFAKAGLVVPGDSLDELDCEDCDYSDFDEYSYKKTNGSVEETVSWIVDLAAGLHRHVVTESAMTAEAIHAILDCYTPILEPGERRAVLKAAYYLATSAALKLNLVTTRGSSCADWVRSSGAIEAQEWWASEDIKACLDGLPEDPDKEAARRGVIESYRASFAGTNPAYLGRLFQEQLARSADDTA